MAQAQLITRATHGDSLADILERVLNTGLVIAGDIRIKLCDVELLSIQLRLLICSVEKARELGISWWWQTSAQPVPAPVIAAKQPPHLFPSRVPHRSGRGIPAVPRIPAVPGRDADAGARAAIGEQAAGRPERNRLRGSDKTAALHVLHHRHNGVIKASQGGGDWPLDKRSELSGPCRML